MTSNAAMPLATLTGLNKEVDPSSCRSASSSLMWTFLASSKKKNAFAHIHADDRNGSIRMRGQPASPAANPATVKEHIL